MPPVEDHAVHERTRIDERHRYGCNNAERAIDGYWVMVRRYNDVTGQYSTQQAYIKNRMSRECRFDRSLTDPSCTECRDRGSGETYDQRVRAAANAGSEGR